MNVSFEGIGEKTATFEAVTTGNAAVKAGEMVTVTANGKVSACGEGDVPAGVAISVRDGYAAVQIGGYMKVECASDVTVGWINGAVDANGKLAEADADGVGRGMLITDVEDGVCGVIM